MTQVLRGNIIQAPRLGELSGIRGLFACIILRQALASLMKMKFSIRSMRSSTASTRV